MTYRGVARGNTIELEQPLPFRDGESVEVSVEPGRARAGTIEAILRAMSEPPHLTDEEVDELERSIAEGLLPVRHEGLFDEPRRAARRS